MPALTPALLQGAFTNFNTLFQAAFKNTPTYRDKISDTVPSVTESETYAWMATLPKMRKWIGARQLHAIAARAQQVFHDKYENSIRVPREKIEDDKLGVFSPALKLLGREAARLPDRLIVNLMQAGLSTGLAYDGQPFFYNSHPVNIDDPNSATYQNRFDSNANGGGIARPLIPSNYGLVRQSMMSYVDIDGEPLGVMPNLLVAPPQLETQAKQVLQATYLAPTATDGAGAANTVQENVHKGSAELLILPHLANDPNRWYLFDTQLIAAFFLQVRDEAEFQSLDQPTAENVFMRDEYLYGVRWRGAGAYGLPFVCATAST